MANRPDAAADPVDVAVGARIRLLRKVRGLSQQALAEAAGVTWIGEIRAGAVLRLHGAGPAAASWRVHEHRL